MGRSSFRDAFNGFVDRHGRAWELVMAGLAVVFVIVGFLGDEPGASPVYGLIDASLTVLFVGEFSTRFLAAYDRPGYLKGHWIDVLALIPTMRAARVLRLLRLLRLVRAFAGVFRFISGIERLAHHRGLAWLISAWLGVMVICSLALYAAENGVNAAVQSPLDALWWGISTMTTVGYGDVYPVTPEGRIAATVLMVLGIGLLSAITAIVTSFLIESYGISDDPIDQLRRLGELRNSGLMTPEEFEAKRRKLVESI